MKHAVPDETASNPYKTAGPDAAAPAEEPSAPDALGVGAQLGRYVLEGELGAGGMGVVYAARDPQLERTVALKVLREHGTRRSAASDESARARLLREGRAMAKLVHPNVIRVYDLGIHDGRVFVAMELIDGGNLKEWLAQGRRSWREVLAVFASAGRGLVAAHQAGIVHRDFKPANVLLARDGRVLVTDFGIARLSESDSTAGDEEAPSEPTSAEITLTRTGAVIGTPEYMSPEQLRGAVVDARADQFAFCVALYEALYGERPFDEPEPEASLGLSPLDQVKLKVLGGRVRPAPRGSTVPAWVRQHLLRGLQPEPKDRFPSMAALLAALGADPALRRRRLGAALAVFGLLALAAWGLVRGRDRAAEVCGGAAELLHGTWDGAARARISAAFAATGRKYAADTAARVARQLDRYAGAWATMRTEACRATRVRGDQSEALLDLRMACLERRRGALAALAEVLGHADAETLDRAVLAASALESLGGCADADALTARVPPPADPATRARLAQLNARLDRVTARRDAGQLKAALADALPLLADADATGYALARARAHGLAGELHSLLDEGDAAERELTSAVRLAAEARDSALESRTLILLSLCYSDEKSNAQEALLSARLAEAAAVRAGGDELLLADAHFQLAATLPSVPDANQLSEAAFAVYERRFAANDPRLLEPFMRRFRQLEDAGRNDDARAWGERTLALGQAVLGPDHPRVSNIYNELGATASAQGKFDDARRFHERSLAIKEAAFGPDHPQVAIALSNLGGVAKAEGDWERASAFYERALAIRERALGPKSMQVGTVLNNLASVRLNQGRYAEAEGLGARAIAIYVETMGPDSPRAASAYLNQGELFLRQGKLADARRFFTQAVAARKKSLGPDHPDYAFALLTLAGLSISEAHCREALPLIDEAGRVIEKAIGADHYEMARVLVERGLCLEETARPADAVAPLEQAVALIEKGPAYPIELGHARFVLARALWASGRDRARARLEAAKAQAETEKAGPSAAENLAEIRAWRQKHPG